MGGIDKETVATAFKEWFADRSVFDVTIFSDSLETEDGLGYSYAIYKG